MLRNALTRNYDRLDELLADAKQPPKGKKKDEQNDAYD
jgi:hypothetical protein